LDKKVQKKPRTPGFEEYLAGAFLGYTVSMIPLLVLSFFFQIYNIDPGSLDTFLLLLIISAPNFFGGVVAGHMVVRRAEIDHLKVGVKTGLGCILLTGLITGILESRPANPIALAMVFLGCTFSGYLYGRNYQKKTETQNK